MELFLSIVSNFLCCLFFILFVSKLIVILKGCNSFIKEFVCCLVKILVGIMSVFWKLFLVVVYMVIDVIIVLFELMFFCSK